MKILILGDFFVDSDAALDSVELEGYDLVIINLEAPLVDDGDVHPSVKLGPNLKMSTAIASRLSELGVTHCTLANNHIMDYGVFGLKSTVAALERQNIFPLGYSLDERKNYSVFGDLVFYNFGQRENGFLRHGNPGYCGQSFIDAGKEIQSLAVSRIVIVLYHGGIELAQYPHPTLYSGARHLIDCGASTVICHHSHVVGKAELYHGKFIHYGIGNFVFCRNKKHLGNGVGIVLTQEGDTINIEEVSIEKGHVSTTTKPLSTEEVTIGSIVKEISENVMYDHLIIKLMNFGLMRRLIIRFTGIRAIQLISKKRRATLATILNNDAHADVLKQLL